MQLILGSQSPRRKEILSYFSIPFVQVSPVFDEESIPFQGNPEGYVRVLSGGKAESLAERFPASAILTADTIVFHAGKVYGKPKNEKEAYQILSELSGQKHTVYTGVTVRYGAQIFQQFEASHVFFKELTPQQIHHYLANTNWGDKAGGYAIQMSGGLIVRKIDGCYYNVMGLPINAVETLLKRVGIDLWSHPWR